MEKKIFFFFPLNGSVRLNFLVEKVFILFSFGKWVRMRRRERERENIRKKRKDKN